MEDVVLYCFGKHVPQATACAEELNLNVVEIFGKSVMSEPLDQICDVIYYMKENHIDRLVIPTCLTLSTKVVEFLSIIHTFEEYGLSLTILEPKMDAINKGVMSSHFKMTIEVMRQFDIVRQKAMLKRMEKAHASYRLYLQNGGKVGRKNGFRKKLQAYEREYAKELSLLRSGVSLKQCHQQTEISINTLRKLKTLFHL